MNQNDISNKTCLVTGVAGFIGSHLAEALVAQGHHVIGVDAFVDFYPRALKESNLSALRQEPMFQFIEADLRTANLNQLLAGGDAMHSAADTTTARNELGFSPRFTLEDGLRKEVEWLSELLTEPVTRPA